MSDRSTEALTVLILAASERDAQAMGMALRHTGRLIAYYTAESVDAFIDKLNRPGWDLILYDPAWGVLSLADVARATVAAAPGVPIMALGDDWQRLAWIPAVRALIQARSELAGAASQDCRLRADVSDRRFGRPC